MRSNAYCGNLLWQSSLTRQASGEGLADGTLAIMSIAFDVNGKPVITTAPVVEGHTDFTSAVIGTPVLDNWSSPVVLENKSGDEWTLPVGASANFFRVRLSE